MPATKKARKPKTSRGADKTAATAQSNKVPEYAQNFEHSLRRFAIEKEQARRPTKK